MFPCLLDPPCQFQVFWKGLEDELVGFCNVVGLAGERGPSEWSSPLAEHWTDVPLDEAWNLEGFLHSCVECLLSNVVAVLESDRALLGHFDHRLHMDGYAFASLLKILRRVGSTECISLLL